MVWRHKREGEDGNRTLLRNVGEEGEIEIGADVVEVHPEVD